ncbi:MAG: cation:proton antiporter [Thiotrichales bacterium]|nr:cation:proton antiporter [Thiotrichales bacterium]
MDVFINLVLLGLLAVTALGILAMRQLFAAAMMSGLYSLLAASVFVTLDAVDVAFTEAAVGAGIATILLLGALSHTDKMERSRPSRPWLSLLIVGLTGAALVYATFDMPLFGDPAAPAHVHVAPYYLSVSGEEIGVPNVVTSVLASYRGYDTLGEVAVIFTAGIAVLALIGRVRGREQMSEGSDTDREHR